MFEPNDIPVERHRRRMIVDLEDCVIQTKRHGSNLLGAVA